MGGDDKKGSTGTTVVNTQPAPAQIAPEFSQFAANVGAGATQHLANFPLTPFASPVILDVPGLNDMQYNALGLIGDRTINGIQRPDAQRDLYSLFPYASNVAQTQIGLSPHEYTAMGAAGNLPGQVAQAVGTDPIRSQAYQNTQAMQDWAGNAVGTDPTRQQMYGQSAALQGTVGQQVPVSQARADMLSHVGGIQTGMGEVVPLQSQEQAALNMYGQMPDVVGYGTNPYETAGANALQQFSSGGISGSPAMQAAAAQIANAVTPGVQNRMAAAGLGRSGAMASELQNAMVGALLPLYMQGMKQQQESGTTLANLGLQQSGQELSALEQAARGQAQIGGAAAGRQSDAMNRVMSLEQLYQGTGNALAGAQEGLSGDAFQRMLAAQPYLLQSGTGLAQANEGLTTDAMNRAVGLEPLLQQSARDIAASREGLSTDAINRFQSSVANTMIPTFMSAGGQDAARQSDTLNRILQTTQNQYNPLMQLGQSELDRETQRISEALSGGALQRDIQGQMNQAEYADAMRRQALAETFHTAMLGAIPSLSTFPSTSTTTYRSPTDK